MEFILGMFFSPIVLCIFIALSLLFEYKEARGFAGTCFILAGIIVYSLLGLSLQTLGMVAALWVPVGLGWSIWRWSRYCSNIVKQAEAGEISKSTAKWEVDFKHKTPTLVYWVIFWPVSLVEMLLSDIFDIIETLVTKVFKGTYARIANNASSKLDKLEDNPSSGAWREYK